MLINIVLGDRYRDGGGLTRNVIIQSPVDVDTFTAAVKEGIRVLGFDPLFKLGSEEGPWVIRPEQVRYMEEQGLSLFSDSCPTDWGWCWRQGHWERIKGYRINYEEYIEVYLFLAQLGKIDVSYVHIQELYIENTYHLGGRL